MVVSAGDPELIEGINEAYRCAEQMKLDAVRQDPQQLQVVGQRFDAVCARLFKAARTGV